MAAFFALLSGKAALAAKPKFKTYPERFDYEKGFADYYEKLSAPWPIVLRKNVSRRSKPRGGGGFGRCRCCYFFFGRGGLYCFYGK